MNPSYIGAVWMFGGNFAPANFNFCDGSIQQISQNEALYALLGTTYGGDGNTTFALPDLRGRVAISQGSGPDLPAYVLGQKAGAESLTITTQQMAAHTHLLNVGTNATATAPASNLFLNQLTAGGTAQQVYSDAVPNAVMAPGTIGTAGNNIPINIIQPVLAVSYVIAMYGIFPSQN